MSIHVIVHDPSGDRGIEYEGQTQDEISALLYQQPFSFDFVSEEAYAAFLATVKKGPPPQDPDIVSAKAVIDNKNSAVADKVDSIIVLLKKSGVI